MSLKSFLSGKSDKEIKFQEIIKRLQPKKNEFETISNKKAFSNEFEIKAPNELSKSNYSMVVGTSFDYLARFKVAQLINKNKDTVYCNLVAEGFFKRFENSLDKSIYDKSYKLFQEGIEYVKYFVNSKAEVHDKLLFYVYYFSNLERAWRSAVLPEDINSIFNEPEKEIKDDLINLINVFQDSFLNVVVKPDSIVYFNPKFGVSSTYVHGADADIYIDGTLYDFKTSKKYGYVGKDVQQIIGYYLLHEMEVRYDDIFCEFRNYEINKIALYLARFGEIVYFDMNKLDRDIIESCIDDLINLFK